MPDIFIVFRYRPVGGEVPCHRDVGQHLLAPRLAIRILFVCAVLGGNIVFQVQKCHEPVLLDQFRMNLKQMVRIADLHHLWADNEVDQGADLLVINM